MSPVALHAGAADSSGVEDAEAEAPGVALVPLLEVADGDEAVQPLTASSNAAPAKTPANRWGFTPM
jgi:hypothetical protein